MALRLEPLVPRVLVVVCDSWGVGGAPDAAAYADEGSDTLGNTSRAVGGIHAPALESLGLGLLTSIEGSPPGRTRARRTDGRSNAPPARTRPPGTGR